MMAMKMASEFWCEEWNESNLEDLTPNLLLYLGGAYDDAWRK